MTWRRMTFRDLCMILLLLAVGMGVAHCQTRLRPYSTQVHSRYMVELLNQRRVAMGLAPAQYSQSRTDFAQFYNHKVAAHGTLSHDLIPDADKRDLLLALQELRGEDYITTLVTDWELLSWHSPDHTAIASLETFMSNLFNDSQEHFNSLFHERTQHIGIAYHQTELGTYATVMAVHPPK